MNTFAEIDKLAAGDTITIDGEPRRIVILSVDRHPRRTQIITRAQAQVVPSHNEGGWINLLTSGWSPACTA